MIKVVTLKSCQCNCCKNWRMFDWSKESDNFRADNDRLKKSVKDLTNNLFHETANLEKAKWALKEACDCDLDGIGGLCETCQCLKELDK